MAEEELKKYYTNCNQTLLNNIPENLGRVLEFGCSGGMLGNSYKHQNKDTVWHGIDIFEPAVQHAKKMIDQAWKLDANNLKRNKLMTEASYDTLVYGDVIEHLIQPEDSLPDHLELLKPGGLVITCIPNVQNWSVLRHVIKGNWTYQDRGILDRTHLRFFTRKSFGRLLQSLGLEILKVHRIDSQSNDESQEFIESLVELCNKHDMKFVEDDYRAFQYVFVSRKKST